MKKLLLLILLATAANAQAQPLPNGNLDNWQQSQSGLYDQPTGGFWATLNALRDLGGPVTVEKTTDACEGQFAAKLTTGNFSSLLVAGLMASGTFNQFNLANPLTIGRPFTLKPVTFSGCYKYSPVNGDSAALISILTKWNTQTNTRDTLAFAGEVTTTAQGSYVTFNYTYEYYDNQTTPDSIQLVFSSSADGANNNGQIGSAMWVDNVSLGILDNINLPLMPEVDVKCYPNPTVDKATFDLSDVKGSSMLTIYTNDGKLIMQKQVPSGFETIDFTGYPIGQYVYTLSQNNKAIYWGTLQHN